MLPRVCEMKENFVKVINDRFIEAPQKEKKKSLKYLLNRNIIKSL